METPCIHVCAIDTPSGLCAGCGRSLPEIGGWSGYSDHERSVIMQRLSARLTHLNRHRETL